MAKLSLTDMHHHSFQFIHVIFRHMLFLRFFQCLIGERE
jgi:hypothetical protein